MLFLFETPTSSYVCLLYYLPFVIKYYHLQIATKEGVAPVTRAKGRGGTEGTNALRRCMYGRPVPEGLGGRQTGRRDTSGGSGGDGWWGVRQGGRCGWRSGGARRGGGGSGERRGGGEQWLRGPKICRARAGTRTRMRMCVCTVCIYMHM